MANLIERDHIGIFGKMNSGKSSIMNLLTQHNTSIVDSTPGTTADTKISLLEIHGIGPVKLFDTAGADESSILGEKKRSKVFSNLKVCDLVILVIDPSKNNFYTELEIINKTRELEKQLIVIYNIFKMEDIDKIKDIESEISLLQFYKKIQINANDKSYRQSLINFVIDNLESKSDKVPLLPFLKENEYYILIIPMDTETPPGRYLRPQAMVEEYITRNWAYPVSFRLDLGKARCNNSSESEKEKKRFLTLLNNFNKKPKVIITDSQAMDIMNKWCPNDIALTTFSITMINYMSRGKINSFINGVEVISTLKKGDRVLIAEACNHSRIGEDIGTVQIPKYLNKLIPGIQIEHCFGREFQENRELQNYKLIIHCGGCMITPQTLTARLRDLENIKVPFTNYGFVLSYIQGKAALKKVIEPWIKG